MKLLGDDWNVLDYKFHEETLRDSNGENDSVNLFILMKATHFCDLLQTYHFTLTVLYTFRYGLGVN